MTIMNTPSYASNYSYIVARYVDGEYWFYGAYADEDRAYSVAEDIDGQVFHQ